MRYSETKRDSRIRATLKRLARERGDVLTGERQRDIVAKLELLTHASDVEKAKHVEQIEVRKGKPGGGRKV